HPVVLLTMCISFVSSSGMSFSPNRQVIFKQSLTMGEKKDYEINENNEIDEKMWVFSSISLFSFIS
ncbi:MAG: hypothetical protein L0220_27225, partial [Acidobacteria bacterium]|nr:hypothetical protein [Acidobacteriota bacterium]